MSEPAVVLSNVTKMYGDFCAVSNFNLEVGIGEYIAFLGPSGCGKTTTLRMLAGLEEITSGDIYISGKKVNELPPGSRDTSLMFQNFALFTHMSVRRNIAFGLRMRGVEKATRDKRVQEMLDTVGLSEFANRKPSDLSGGQQQRVALARALITEPSVMLLDEPLGHLDELLRIKLRGDLKHLQRNLGIPFIHVTHNQDECLTMGDRLVVMNKGIIEQIGTPHEIYTKPETFFVASFVGDNFILSGKIIDSQGKMVSLETEKGVFKVVTDRKLPDKNKPCGFAVRADCISIHDENSPSQENCIKGVVNFVEYVGYVVKIRVDLDGGGELIAKETQNEFFSKSVKEGDRVSVVWSAEDAVMLSGDSNIESKSVFEMHGH